VLVLEKIFFNINICKYGFPYWPPRTMMWTILNLHNIIYIISESFHVNMTYSGSVVLVKIFKWPHPIFAFLWSYPLWRGPGPLFEQFRIPFT
jgi:hypothetical protein